MVKVEAAIPRPEYIVGYVDATLSPTPRHPSPVGSGTVQQPSGGLAAARRAGDERGRAAKDALLGAA
jgi:hypothetical protein